LKSLNDFSSFGKPLEITEFEVTIQNPNDVEQRQYQADYLRDYFTVRLQPSTGAHDYAARFLAARGMAV
jgi:GH35 family endo-1,4-beta-xylanase